jgi:demethylmenaquinone methyltransferase/2-methoxy-6-polyprenyl-1,4-benzoquinol methylase
VPRQQLSAFLAGLHAALRPAARVVFLDNLYVPGSSTPVSRRDSHANSYQRRKLADGSEYEVLKNFPDEQEVERLLAGLARNLLFERFDYYWLLSYECPASSAPATRASI